MFSWVDAKVVIGEIELLVLSTWVLPYPFHIFAVLHGEIFASKPLLNGHD